MHYRAVRRLRRTSQQAEQYGQKGLQALQNMTEARRHERRRLHQAPQRTSAAIFDGAVAFAALQKKDFATAQKDFREAVGEESAARLWLTCIRWRTADLEAKPMNPEGFWFIVKASQLAQGPGQQQILEYGRKKYIRYHGKEDGWTDLVNQAKASQSVMPPAGFTVAAAPPPPSPAEQAADLVKSKDPKQMSFAEWELVLSSGNQQAADTVWNALKDKAVKLGANVISATRIQDHAGGQR